MRNAATTQETTPTASSTRGRDASARARCPATYARILGALKPAADAFAHALRDVPRAQDERARAVASHLGVGSVRELQQAVPVTTYEDIGAELEEVAAGRQSRFVGRPVTWFELSGGSSGARRLLPMTDAFIEELQAGLAPWLYGMWSAFGAATAGPAYWSISPMGRGRPLTPSGIPIGAAEDTVYFPPPLPSWLSDVMAVPGAVALMPDVDACRYATARMLLQTADLAFMSVWSPTFLSLLFDTLDEHGDRLLEDLAAGRCRVPGPCRGERQQGIASALEGLALQADPRRAASLRRRLVARGRLDASDLWPGLALVSMWTDAESARFVPQVRGRLGEVSVQGKGLLATEGILSLPLPGAPAPVLAVQSHVVEFLPEGWTPGATPLLPDEVTAGQTYEVVLSTSAGLLRYRLGDRVEVVGFHGGAPCFRFVGRAGAVSDLCGEKLAPAFVQAALDQALDAVSVPARDGDRPRFAMLAPVVPAGGRAHYRLYLEAVWPDDKVIGVARELDARLQTSAPYAYARSLGQLAAVSVMRVERGQARYEQHCGRQGQRAGDIKPVVLHRSADWDRAFDGRLLGGPASAAGSDGAR